MLQQWKIRLVSIYGLKIAELYISELFAYEWGIEVKSEMGHEMDQFLTDFDDFASLKS